MKLSPTKIKFRKIQENDLDILILWRNKEGIRDFNTQFILLNLELQKKWFNNIRKNDERKMFMITYQNKPIGVCGLINIDNENHNADIAIIIGEQKFHGKRIGTIVMKKLLKIGFKNLNLHRISAEVFEFNIISQRFFDSLGFKQEYSQRDKLWRRGRWWDIITYSIFSHEYS